MTPQNPLFSAKELRTPNRYLFQIDDRNQTIKREGFRNYRKRNENWAGGNQYMKINGSINPRSRENGRSKQEKNVRNPKQESNS